MYSYLIKRTVSKWLWYLICIFFAISTAALLEQHCWLQCLFFMTVIRKTWKADEKQGKYKKAEQEQSRLKCVFWGKISQISAELKSPITLPVSFQEEKRRCCWLISIPIKHPFALAERYSQPAGENSALQQAVPIGIGGGGLSQPACFLHP